MPIDFEAFPLREFQRSRRLQWFPEEIDFRQDRIDWAGLAAAEQELLLRQIVGFLIGERAVTHDLAPLQQALRQERGRMEEEIYLTAQMFEEAVHVQFFQRWINETLPGRLGRDIPYPRLEGFIFSETLRSAMNALLTDRSPRAQMRAVAVYHILVEGVLAETGYQFFYDVFDRRPILPGLERGIRSIQRDEARHIAFGTYLLQRLVAEHPALADPFEATMEELTPQAHDAMTRLFEGLGPAIPFGLDPDRYQRLVAEFHRSRVDAVRRGKLLESPATT